MTLRMMKRKGGVIDVMLRKTYRSIFSLILTVSMILGMCLPVRADSEEQEPVYDTYVSTGDNLWVAETPPIDTPEAIDALLDLFEDFGYRRIYWRGLQQALWNKVMVTRDEAVRYVGAIESYRELYKNFNPDKYLVQEAHKRGMEVWGVSTLQDWGASGDTPINFYPAHYEADFRLQNPDWVPKDKHGFMEQGGAVEFSYPEARRHLIDLHMQEVEEVGYDGILFITYSENFSLKYDDQFGFSEPAVEEFYRRYGIVAGKEPFNRWASIYDWRRLRGEYVTEFLRELKQELGDRGLGLFLDPRNPYHMQVWQYDTVISNAIYLDLETWVREGIVDQFLVNGASSVDIQASTLRNMLWMVRDTNVDVAIYTSSPMAPQWQEFKDQGVVVVTQIGGYGEELYYQRSQLVRNTEHTQKMYWLSQVITGTQSATLSQLTPYLSDESLSVRRLAIKAIGKVNPPGAAPYVEAMLQDPEPGVRGQAAFTLRTVGGVNSAEAILETLEDHGEWTLFEAATATMGALLNNSSTASATKSALVSAYQTSENPRVRAAAMRALSLGAAAPDLLNLFVTAVNTEFAPEEASRLETVYYNSIRYYATESIGKISNSSAAVDALITITEGTDTVTSNRAAISLGDMARRGDAILGTRRQDMIDALDVLFGKMGEDSVRADRDWAYRPIGEALIALGESGKAVLQRYMNQREDARLAEFAWKCLYLPQTLQNYSLMTEKEYDEAYLMLPDILKDFTAIKLNQDFGSLIIEANGWAGNNSTSVGRWGPFTSNGPMLDDTIYHSPGGSAKLVRGGGILYGVLSDTSAIKENESYRLSFWVYREPKASFVFMTHNSAGMSQAEIAGVVDENGRIKLRDPATSSYTVDTGLTVPERQWVQLQAVASRSSRKVILTMTPENGEPQQAISDADFIIYPKVARVLFSAQGDAGTVTYIDDVVLEEASPTRRKAEETVSLSDRTVAYNGNPQSIIPQTKPVGIEVLVEYEGIGSTIYPKSEIPPTDSGTYRVTATVTEPGYSGSATATLIIRKANPNLDSAGVTATALEYGQSLGDSQLAGIFYGVNGVPLEGVFSWDEGNEYVPAVTGYHSYTFIPANSNYEKFRGTAQVVVNRNWVGWITRIDQNFEDKSIFTIPTASGWVGDYATTTGRWQLNEAGPVITNERSYSGEQSVKLIRGGGGQALYGGIQPAMATDVDYEVSLMLYRNEGKSFVMNTNPNNISNPEAALIVTATGEIRLYSHSAKSYSISTGLIIPHETWTRLTLSVSRTQGYFTVSITPEGGETAYSTSTSPLPETPIASYVIFINPQAPEGVTAYVDDVMLSEKTTIPQVATVTMPDLTVDYDGKPHELSATTNPVDLEIEVYYTGINGTNYPKSTQPPVNAGTYRVTALVTTDGWAGSANAILTIQKVQPGVSSPVTVINGTLNYGQTLGETGLTGEFLDLEGNPLAGTLTWDEGNDHVLTVSGAHAYTFTPEDPNYAIVCGELFITVLPRVYTITATATAGGTITPSGDVEVIEGEGQTFTFTPNSGYRIQSVTVDGVPQAVSGNSYTFENVTDDHTIHVAFELIPSSGPAPSPSPAPIAEPSSMESDGTVTVSLNTGAALTTDEMSALLNSAKDAESKNKKAVLEIKPSLSDSGQPVQVTLPRTRFDAIASETSADLRISTSFAEITFDSQALDSISGSASPGDIRISVRSVSPDTLSEDVRPKVGNRPVYDFTVTAGDTRVSDFGTGNATVSIPYTPAPGEDTNAIVIYYINDNGDLQIVTNGRYDAATGRVTFTTSHFSYFAVGYNKVQFKDVPSSAWFSNAVSFIAARGITEGVGEGNFAPNKTLTRGQFITLLLRAYGIAPDANPADNFSDAGNTYYTGYIAAAKRLGITHGTGGNRFEPEKTITRQEMFKLLYGTLKAIDKLPQGSTSKRLSDFSDAGQIAPWAKESMEYLVEVGVVSGSDGKLNPNGTATRAEMAQILYNLLNK